MKKLIPVVSPCLFGLFGGLFVECAVCALAIVTSPFSDFEQAPFLSLLFLTSILSGLFTTVIVIFNVAYLINLENKSKAKITVIVEVFVGIVLLFIFWNLWNSIVSWLNTLIF